MNELVASYFMEPNIQFDIYACYDSVKDMDTRKASFYDVYDRRNGKCVTEGDPFFTFPSWQQVFDNYYLTK